MSKTGRDWHAVRLPGGYGRWGVYRILMVEDDEAEAENLRACISRYSVERDVELRVTWLRTAVGITRDESRYDLIFMDIGLPGINGMEAAALLRTYDKRTPLIFVTNLAQYAVRGYEVDALDFVLKPVTYYNFRMRMDKALRVMRRSTGANVTITTRDGMRVVPVADVVAVEVRNHDLSYILSRQEEPLGVRGTLGSAEKALPAGQFVRVSNSCLVNMAYVRSVHGSEVATTTGQTFALSRSRRREAVDRIAQFMGGSI